MFPVMLLPGGEVVNLIPSNYSTHLLLTSCACFHMQGGWEHIWGSRIPRPAFKKCSGKLGAAILLVFRAVKAFLRVCQQERIMDVKTLAWPTRVFTFIHRTSSWCSFLDAWNWRQFLCALLLLVCGTLILVSYVNYGKYTSGAKKQFGTRKCWVWALRGCTCVLSTIPSFRIDHSPITELYIISTNKFPLIPIIYQLATTDWNIIIPPELGTAVSLHMDQRAEHSPPLRQKTTVIIPFFKFFSLCCSFC